MFRRLAMHVCVLLVIVLLLQGVATACPTCKEGLAGDPARANIVRGYFWSIIFMMSMPFLILAGLSSYFYYLVCQARRQADASGSGFHAARALEAELSR